MANSFNNYFLSVADLLNKDNKRDDKNTNPLHYLQNFINKPNNKMEWKYDNKVIKIQEFTWV